MNTFESLEDEACMDGIDVVRCRLSKNIKGLYCDGVVGINEDIETSVEKACTLAEEIGHHDTTVGDILDLSDAQNRKQERQARLRAYNRLIGLKGIIRAHEHGCENSHEIAEYLEVTDEFLYEAVECYRDKYGIGTEAGGYYVMFIPHLQVLRIV